MQLFIPKLQTVIRSDLMHDLTVGAGCPVQCFSFSELSMTMALSIFTLSILQGKLMKHSSQATDVLYLLSRKTQPLRAIMKCVMWKSGSLPTAYCLYSDLKLSLRHSFLYQNVKGIFLRGQCTRHHAKQTNSSS